MITGNQVKKIFPKPIKERGGNGKQIHKKRK